MATSTPAISLDSPVPPGPSVGPSALEMAAAAPLVAPETTSDTVLRLVGTLMMGLGSLAMIVAAVADRMASGAGADHPQSGAIVAAAVFTVIMGLVMRFPTMLQDGTVTEENRPAYSSMRVVVLLVVGAFVMLAIKVGWTTQSLSDLKIDQSWSLVLGVVLGGKVVQGMTEAGVGMKK